MIRGGGPEGANISNSMAFQAPVVDGQVSKTGGVLVPRVAGDMPGGQDRVTSSGTFTPANLADMLMARHASGARSNQTPRVLIQRSAGIPDPHPMLEQTDTRTGQGNGRVTPAISGSALPVSDGQTSNGDMLAEGTDATRITSPRDSVTQTTRNDFRGKTDQDESENISNLEKIFGFRDAAFRDYMMRRSVISISPYRLMELSDEMAKHSHPVVKYAAGWAAAEAAIYRNGHANTNTSDYTLEQRIEALKRAKSLWTESGAAFNAARKSPSTELRGASMSRESLNGHLLIYEYSSLHALAHAQSMELVATMLSGEEIPRETIESTLQKTGERVQVLGATMVDLKVRGMRMVKTRNGACKEITAGLLLQQARPLQYIFLPASFRQDNNHHPDYRGDLQAISIEDQSSTLIQVTSSMDRDATSDKRVIIHAKDLMLTPDQHPRDTLRAYLNWASDKIDDPEIFAKLTERSRALVDKVTAFAKAKNRKITRGDGFAVTVTDN